MSDLQLSLIGAGIGLVAVVFAYNKWQERKHRKLAERVFRGDHPDVLLGRREAEAAVGEAAGGERIEPVMESATVADSPAAESVQSFAARAAMAEPPAELADPVIDCIVRFESAELIGGPSLWQAQQQALAKLTRAVFWSGENERSGQWEHLTAHSAGDYRRLRVALQLADRRGPLADADLTLFMNGVQRLADEFLAVADMPTRNEVLARAAELDGFCAGVDIQIGVNVVAGAAPLAGTKLRGLAEAAGLALRGDGMFHAADEDGATLFTLSNLEAVLFAAEEMKTLATHGITFTLDVPRVADGARAFDRMIALARQFAGSLGGTLVDDNRAPLADSALDVIHDKILEIDQRMAQRGISAGSPQALRLFS
jgi:hypothetical protein